MPPAVRPGALRAPLAYAPVRPFSAAPSSPKPPNVAPGRIGKPAWALALTLTLSVGAASAQAPSVGGATPPREVRHPQVDLGVLSFVSRERAQERALKSSDVLHDFRFVDRQGQSGITFEHGIVDDAGRDYKAVHYDHGNGVVVADVDGDGLLDLFFVNQLGSNGLYRNLGKGKFEDITAKAGVAMEDVIGVTASAADYDNDGDADLYVTTVRMGNVLFENDGNGRFRDVTQARGLELVGHSSGAVFFDYDRDGWLDLFVCNVGRYTHEHTGPGGYHVGFHDAFQGHLRPDRTERSVLYRNLGGKRFEDVSERVGLVDTSWTGDANLTDLDGDGYPELYVLNMQGDDHFWVSKKGEGFVDLRTERFPKTPWGAMGIGVFDFDNDGDQDLYLTDMHSDMFEQITPDRETEKSRVDPKMPGLQGGGDNIFGNAFYVNAGDGTFTERSDALGLENYWPWGLSVGDLNADGFEDIFVTASMNYPFRYGPNSLYLNDAGRRFHDAAFLLGVEPRKGGRTHKPWFDLDCSGADRQHEHCQRKEGPVRILGTLGTRSSALLDLDGDGDLDIVTGEMFAPPQVFLSDLAERRTVRHLAVRLRGHASNRDGLGAIVEVAAGGMTQTQLHDGKSGYLSQSRLPLYFGLGDAGKAERVTVRWPSGQVQVLQNVAADQTLTVEEPAPTAARPKAGDAPVSPATAKDPESSPRPTR